MEIYEYKVALFENRYPEEFLIFIRYFWNMLEDTGATPAMEGFNNFTP